MKKIILFTLALMATGLARAQHIEFKEPPKTKSKPKSGSSHSSSRKSSHSSSHKKRGSSESGHMFNFSFGISLAMSNTVTTELSDAHGKATITRSVSGFGLYAYPKFNIVSNENYSISIGIPLTFAFSSTANYNSRTGAESESAFIYDLPLMVDYNGGVMAPQRKYGDGRFGYFVGLGFGIENGDVTNFAFESSGYTGDYSGYTKGKSIGPNIHAGIVFRTANPDKPKFFGLRVSYKIGLGGDKFNYLTPSVFMDL